MAANRRVTCLDKREAARDVVMKKACLSCRERLVAEIDLEPIPNIMGVSRRLTLFPLPCDMYERFTGSFAC
jgi:hypothetical protein